MKSNLHLQQVDSIPASFRLLVQSELARRCGDNPQYSLRAFAKYLGIDHSTLSQLLRGKRSLTEKSIRKIGIRLNVSEADILRWIHREESHEINETINGQIRQLTQDIASVMTDVTHYAILELTRIKGFQADSRWIARVLDISVDEVNVALQSLIRLGLLEMVSPTHWIDHAGNSMGTMDDFTQASIEHYLRQLHELTLRSVQQKTIKRHAITATTLAVNSARVPAAIEMIARFRSELANFLAGTEGHNDVYHLQISFLPITNLPKEK